MYLCYYKTHPRICNDHDCVSLLEHSILDSIYYGILNRHQIDIHITLVGIEFAPVGAT